MKTVNWGIVGCGNVCERKSGPAMYKTPHSALAAVMRRDAEKAADFARRHNVPKSYTDAAALIADPEVDIVYVATPPGTHRELAVQALEAGKPVYVEKPMAMNHAECLEMIAAAEKAGQKLFVAYYRRALPYFLKVKELLDSGAVGEELGVEVRYFRPESPGDRDPARLPWRLRREVGGEGYFYDMLHLKSAAARLMSHSRSMSSADCTLHPHSTQAGASRREANTLAACSMGLSPGSGSRHTRSYRPTWPRMMCPSSCAQVKRCRAGIARLDTMIVGAPPMMVDMPCAGNIR